jgi:hypothetical protein
MLADSRCSKACATRIHALSSLCVRGATAFCNKPRPELRDSDARPQGLLHLWRHSLRQQPKACATRMHARSGPCTRGATALVHRIGPATLSDTSLRGRQPTWRRSYQAQCFSSRPSDTQAVKTTGQAEHTCSTPSLGTAPRHCNYPRLALLGCTPSAASAPAVPQPSSTGSAQRHPSPRAAAETTDPVEDDMHPAQLGYAPLRPLYPQCRTTQHGPAQRHSLTHQGPAQQHSPRVTHILYETYLAFGLGL